MLCIMSEQDSILIWLVFGANTTTPDTDDFQFANTSFLLDYSFGPEIIRAHKITILTLKRFN